MVREWRGATVEPGGDRPDPNAWEQVELPGKPSKFADADGVAYQTHFPDPRDGDEHAMLVLDGVYAHARVWLNGSFLGEHDAYFEPFERRLDADLEAENELLVECRRPGDRFGGSYESDDVPNERSVPGIWWGAEIETYGEARISNLTARPRLDDEGARFEVTTTVFAETDLEDRLTFSVRPEGSRRGRGMMNRASVQASAGERTTVEHEIDIRDPVLWWPHELGDQSRYVLRAKLHDEERTVTTGLCSVEYDDEEGLVVNGQRMMGRGVNLFAAEPADVDRAIDVNANLVRAHAHVPSQAVYEAADDAGILVWQDLPLTGPGPFDVERGRNLLSRLVDAYDQHPSLAAIGVHDDPATLGTGLGTGTLDRLRLRWRMWRAEYDREAADAVAGAVPDGLATFPVIGPPGIDADATTLSPGWEYGDATDIEWFLDRFPDVGDIVAEFGAGSLGSDATASEIPGFDREIHDRRVENGREASQAYQRDVVKTVTEGLRRHESHVIVASSLRDLGGAGTGVLSDDGTAKPAAEALSDGFEPLQAFLTDPRPGATSDLVVRNDIPSAAGGEITWTIDEETQTSEFTLDGNTATTIGEVTVPDDAQTVELTVSLGERSVSNRYYL